jgi:SM-20-related protein
MDISPQTAQFEHIIEGILQHGLGICDNFFSPAEIEILIAEFDSQYTSGTFRAAAIGRSTSLQTDTSIRGDKILWLSQHSQKPSLNMFFSKINLLLAYLNQTCNLGINGSEFHLAKYEKGKYYIRHKDSFQSKKGRILSVILYLNQNWQQDHAGQLQIYTQQEGKEQATTIAPIAGRLVCFESNKIDHEVLKTNKDRLSITGWFLKN